MLTSVDASRRIQWSTFTVQNEFAVNFNVNSQYSVITDDMINVMLNYKSWQGTRYLEDSTYKIGYGIGDPDNEQGQTESESWGEWVGWIRSRQRIVRAQLTVSALPQTMFDALVSLQIDTGSWRRVEAAEGTYDVASAIKNSNWLLAADMIAQGRVNKPLRQQEAQVSQLGTYGVQKTREKQRVRGVQDIRKRYVNGITSEFDKKQAEFVYYRELGIFLPGMSDLRERRIKNQALP